ncbi:MAG TPA: FtsX-like permease family protein, partial [Blastocatellia bacterium]|nr:FtsX-like permease family protein [Blastocatellia bacterium]
GLKPRDPVTFVGVVKDSKYRSVDEPPMPMAYYPYAQVRGVTHLEVEVRVKGIGTSILPSIGRAVHTLDSNLPLENPMTQQAVFEQSYSSSQMFSRLSAFFGLLAAFLVAIGLYGTLAYRLGRRTAEIGVRMALGAKPAGILWLLLRESLQVTAAGLAVGMIMALISAGFMESLLFGLKPRDPVTFVGALLTVLVVALAASFLPARQAASIAPMKALRTE